MPGSEHSARFNKRLKLNGKIMKKETLIIIAVVSVLAIAAILALKPFSKKETAINFNTVKVEKAA